MSVKCRFYVGFMSVFESKLKSYMIENMIFTEKCMSDVSKFAKILTEVFSFINQDCLG